MDKTMEIISDSMWYSMVDAGMSMPVQLVDADLTKDYVYYRKYGLFYVSPGNHIAAMSLLLAKDLGELYVSNLPKRLHLSQHSPVALSDYFLEHTLGTCFKSSVGKNVYTWSKKHLNEMEKDFFSNIKYIEKN